MPQTGVATVSKPKLENGEPPGTVVARESSDFAVTLIKNTVESTKDSGQGAQMNILLLQLKV